MKVVKFVYIIKKPKSRPSVGSSSAHDFSETVAVDLKRFRNGYILHLVDDSARFIEGAMIY